MKNFNKAFTLTELLVALGVIAILCAVLLPVIFNLLPNQNVIMAKRAFYATQTVVADLINNEACYPDKTSLTTDKRIGFDDGFGFPNCTKWNTAITTEGDATTKFITLFTDKLGNDTTAKETVFTTDDGMAWVFTSPAFAHSGDGGSIKLTVDVNGVGEKPDCGSSGDYSTEFGSGGGEGCSSKTNLDRFQMTIYGNGKIEIADDWAKDAVKVNKNITDEK